MPLRAAVEPLGREALPVAAVLDGPINEGLHREFGGEIQVVRVRGGEHGGITGSLADLHRLADHACHKDRVERSVKGGPAQVIRVAPCCCGVEEIVFKAPPGHDFGPRARESGQEAKDREGEQVVGP